MVGDYDQSASFLQRSRSSIEEFLQRLHFLVDLNTQSLVNFCKELVLSELRQHPLQSPVQVGSGHDTGPFPGGTYQPRHFAALVHLSPQTENLLQFLLGVVVHDILGSKVSHIVHPHIQWSVKPE